MLHMLMLIFIPVILAALWFAAGWSAFRAACGRGIQLDLNDRERIRGTAWERYDKEIMRGIDWITAQPQEEVMITASDGIELYGNLIRNPEVRGTVILFHGYRTFGNCDFSADADQRPHDR